MIYADGNTVCTVGRIEISDVGLLVRYVKRAKLRGMQIAFYSVSLHDCQISLALGSGRTNNKH